MRRSILFCLLLCLSLCCGPASRAWAEPLGAFRGMFGGVEDLNEHSKRVVLADLGQNRIQSLDLFLDGVEALDDPSVFAPAVKTLVQNVQWRIVHREGPSGLAPRLERLLKIARDTQALPAPKPIVFPRDGGKHLNKLMEWWYFNGHLFDEAGAEYGYELCFFRASPFVTFAHVAITDVNGRRFFYQRRMFSPFDTSISDQRMELSFDDWEVGFLGDQFFQLKAQNGDLALNLRVKSSRPPLLFNQSGYVKMSKDGSSYYYSLTSMETRGAIRIGGRSFTVKGQTWFDHQWGNFAVSCVWGWDWFCLKLDDGTRYNVFGFHDEKGRLFNPVVSSLNPDNTQKTTYALKLRPLSTWTSPHTGRTYPSGYEIQLPDWNTNFRVVPKVLDQELPANAPSLDFIDYWEGTCSVTGQVDGKPVQGMAYNEICGYPKTAR